MANNDQYFYDEIYFIKPNSDSNEKLFVLIEGVQVLYRNRFLFLSIFSALRVLTISSAFGSFH